MSKTSPATAESPKPRMLPLEQVRWRLGTLWFTGSGLILTLLIIQSLTGVYEAQVQAVWSWALPNVMPTLSMMIGVFAYAALSQSVESDSMRVRLYFYRLAVGLSLFHLLALSGTLLVQPFAGSLQVGDGPPDPMGLFDVSNLWLGPTQGAAAAALGALFFSKSDRGSDRPQ